MRLLKTLGILAAVTLMAAPAFADRPANLPPKAAPAKAPPKAPRAKAPPKAQPSKQAKQKKRADRLVQAMKKQGISEEKAKRVVAVLEKSWPEIRDVRKQIRSAKQDLKANDKNAEAKKKLEAAKQRRDALKQRIDGEVGKILTAAEHAKVKKLIKRGLRQRKHRQHRRSASS